MTQWDTTMTKHSVIATLKKLVIATREKVVISVIDLYVIPRLDRGISSYNRLSGQDETMTRVGHDNDTANAYLFE